MAQPSPFVELFTLDTTVLGGAIYYFTPNIFANGSNVSYQGHVYQTAPILLSNWEIMTTSSAGNAGGGTQPRPSLSITNVNKLLLAQIISMNDLVGATFTRIRTFQKYLDGQPSASNTEYIGPDTYKINQKVSHNKNTVSWTMSTGIDLPLAQIPARQILKDGTPLNPRGFPGTTQY